MNQSVTKHPPLPNDEELRDRLATIIASVGRCEREPLLEGKPFTEVVDQFDSLLVLEILLEIEAQFRVETDEMLGEHAHEPGHEISAVFPKDLDGLVAYIHEVVARRALVAASALVVPVTPATASAESAAPAPAAPAVVDATAPAADATPRAAENRDDR